jgi:hypothetical protein
MHREVHKYAELLIRIQLATDACIKRRRHVFQEKKARVHFLLTVLQEN